MTRRYQAKHLPDGSPNPRYKPRARPRPRKLLADGTPNPAWKPRASGPSTSSGSSGKRLLQKLGNAERPIVAWDSEGATIARRHEIVLLCNSDGLTASFPQGASTRDIFDAMLSHRSPRHAIHVIFGSNYDVNMWVRDLPRDALAHLWARGWVRWEGFTVTWVPRHTFSLKDEAGRKITIWETFGFWQKSFVAAIEDAGLATREDIDRVATWKARRDRFRASELPEIARYCVSECRLLVALVEQLRGHLTRANLLSGRWDGAGAVASQALKVNAVHDMIANLPRDVRHAAEHAYYGGRIEQIRYGKHDGTVYEYDINSAYPHAAVALPCLKHGAWRRVDPARALALLDRLGEMYAVWRVRWDDYRLDAGDNAPGLFGLDETRAEEPPFYPFPWRSETGGIYYPTAGETWVWTPELRSALAWCDRFDKRFEILDVWQFVPGCDDLPFSWVPPMYAERARAKAQGDGIEQVLKLALNATYGKLAQKVSRGKSSRPPFHNLFWAGWITSQTRAALLSAALRRAGDVIAFATDAIYATAPVSVPQGDALGEWKAKEHDGGLFVQSGVYWLRDAGRWTVYHTRGFGRTSLEPERVARAWARGRSTLTIRERRFIGLGAVVGSSKPETWRRWRQWVTQPRHIDCTPLGHKRDPHPWARETPPAQGLCPTLAHAPFSVESTTPIDRPDYSGWEGERDAVDTEAQTTEG